MLLKARLFTLPFHLTQKCSNGAAHFRDMKGVCLVEILLWLDWPGNESSVLSLLIPLFPLLPFSSHFVLTSPEAVLLFQQGGTLWFMSAKCL